MRYNNIKYSIVTNIGNPHSLSTTPNNTKDWKSGSCCPQSYSRYFMVRFYQNCTPSQLYT